MLVPSASGRQKPGGFLPINGSSDDRAMDIMKIIVTSALQSFCARKDCCILLVQQTRTCGRYLYSPSDFSVREWTESIQFPLSRVLSIESFLPGFLHFHASFAMSWYLPGVSFLNMLSQTGIIKRPDTNESRKTIQIREKIKEIFGSDCAMNDDMLLKRYTVTSDGELIVIVKWPVSREICLSVQVFCHSIHQDMQLPMLTFFCGWWNAGLFVSLISPWGIWHEIPKY